MSSLRVLLSTADYGLRLVGAVLGANAIRLGVLGVTGTVVPRPLLVASAGGAVLALSADWMILNRNPGFGTSRVVRDRWRW
jgi:hypothetical protein